MSENLAEQFAVLPGNLANHLMITAIPLAIGAAISLPLAVFVVKHPRLRYPTLTAVSVVQTIPSLALLALMVPLLAGVSSLTLAAFGFEVSALGFWPAVIALTLYSMLPMVRNTVTGITGVEPSLIEAAVGVGMTPRQVLWKVELPLAAPVIIAGVRTATVWVVGIATLATPVGQRCLGNYIFSGLQTRNWTAVLFGCVAAALLAILLDLLIGGVEKGTRERRRSLTIGCVAALLALMAGGMIGPSLVRAIKSAGSDASGRVVWIGSKTFTEQYILADLIGDLLRDAGFNVREKESLGSTVIFDALAGGEIDVYVDYSGTIWANYMSDEARRPATQPSSAPATTLSPSRNQPQKAGPAAPPDAETVLRVMTDWLLEKHGIRCLGPLGFENAYGLAMRRDRAEQLGIRTIGDLAAHDQNLSIGGDYEFFGRPEWRAIRDAYGLSFADQISYDSTFMYDAVRNGEVAVISAFTSDGRISAYDLLMLDDPLNAIPPYDAVLLLSQRAARLPRIVEALAPLIRAIPVERMREANHLVDRSENKQTIDQAAQWLRDRLPR